MNTATSSFVTTNLITDQFRHSLEQLRRVTLIRVCLPDNQKAQGAVLTDKENFQFAEKGVVRLTLMRMMKESSPSPVKFAVTCALLM